MSVSEQDIVDGLRGVALPGTSSNVVDGGAVREVEVEDGRVRVTLAVEASMPGGTAPLREAVERALGAVSGVTAVEARVQTLLATVGPSPQPAPTWADRIRGVRHLVAVASGKGGVGKSTVSANLAIGLARSGRRVGLMDADIYGPSQQLMMGSGSGPKADEAGRILPVEGAGGVSVMSLGFLIDVDQPVIWRGPMLAKALEQFVADVAWGELDYLIVDLPPGTGDVALTLCQNLPFAGAVIVTTPQDIALIDARKSLNMFKKLGVPVLGIVENMAHYQCPQCGHVEHVFGTGGGLRTAEELELPFLGSIPLDPAVVSGGDSGRPVLLDRPETAAARALAELAAKVDVAVAGGPGYSPSE